jgi:hypothetical protein
MAETDRELLELAAKASGCHYANGTLWAGLEIDLWPGREVLRYCWDPKTDDCDGARLEAALELEVTWDRGIVTVRRLRREGHIVAFERFVDHDGDKQAARRMATLRCAAAIGRAAATEREK